VSSSSAFPRTTVNTIANMARPTKAGNSAPAKVSQSTANQTIVKKSEDYTSEGVEDHDVFLLPGSDYQAMIAVTVLATVVRLFRIYQPSSVVFDEVQYVVPLVCNLTTTN
jgi:dolichyl-phosphate-mannose-protein mannosyltransferase